MNKTLVAIITLVLTISHLTSCSTVKVVPEGEYRLKKNSVIIPVSSKVKESELMSYIRQKPNNDIVLGWNPFLNIYNWSDGTGSGWDRFVTRLGQAPVIFDSALVKKSNDNIESYLESLGYYDSKVKDSITLKNKIASVIYTVHPGKRYPISDIKYDIPDEFINSFVSSDSSSSIIHKGDYLSEKKLEEESERITTKLRDIGYYNFSKNYFFFVADTLIHKDSATLLIRILNYTRNEKPEDSKKHSKYSINRVKIYSSYDPTDPNSYLSEESDTTLINGVEIINQGGTIINPSVLYKMNQIRPGDLYSEKRVNTTYDRLLALRLFSGVNLQFDELSVNKGDRIDSATVDATIRLTPSKMQGYKINIEASSNSNGLLGISPAISYYHKNIFKGGEWLNLGFMGNFQFKINDPVKSTELGVSAGISTPNFLLLPDRIFKYSVPRTDINLSYNYQNRPEFTRNLISLNYGYNWNNGRMYYRINPIQLSIVKLNNMSETFYESLTDPFLRNSYMNHFDMGAGATLYYTTDSSPYPKNSYFYIRWINDISGNLLSLFNSKMPIDSTGAKTIWNTPYSQYFRTDLTLSRTWRIDEKNAFAARFNGGVGVSYGNSKSLPFEKLFYAGGANSLRGWQARSVGPGSAPVDTTFSIPNQTGDLKLELNAEFRFLMFWKLEGALFADLGNIWTIKSEQGREEGRFRFNDFYKSIAFNWGFGARLNLDFVILRLDLGMVAYDPVKRSWIKPFNWFQNDTYSLQFGVGYPF
ncbi:MAG: BamA/TamA family outer membrane protein [Bacteroidales bacterium]|jgi:outer membrane protein assembly factor BamA|nr:BamA/TamA family outer membrane protein [Bacteroidales bacterium]MDD4057631.1 BamA/TamA family outer membrane protein [Bacteroidales bacterium]